MVLFLFSILAAAILAVTVYSQIAKGRIDPKVIIAVICSIVTTFLLIQSGILPFGGLNLTNNSLLLFSMGVGSSSIVEPPKNNSFIPESLQNLTNLSMVENYQKTYQPYWQGEFG